MDKYVTFNPQIPKYQPTITKILIIIISLFFLTELYLNATHNDKTLIILGAKWNEGITRGEYWRFLSCVFLHGNILHLFVNITALYIFGREVESIFGSFRFLILFLYSSWGASLTSYIFSPGISIGASGALFGIIGGLIIFFFRQRENVSGAILRFKSMYTLVAINLLFGFLVPRIDNSAHIGGLITGLFTSLFISPEYEIKKDDLQEVLYVKRNKNITKLCFGIFLTGAILFYLSKTAIGLLQK